MQEEVSDASGASPEAAGRAFEAVTPGCARWAVGGEARETGCEFVDGGEGAGGGKGGVRDVSESAFGGHCVISCPSTSAPM